MGHYAMQEAERMIGVESPIFIKSFKDFQPGDFFILGRRRWNFVGTTAETHPGQQEESIWERDHEAEPGAVDQRRVMAWSEVEQLQQLGLIKRMAPTTIKFSAGSTVRGTEKVTA